MTLDVRRSDELDDEIVGFIAMYVAARGYAPTVREVGDHVGRSVQAVWQRLYRLRRQGRVDWTDRQPRTLHVVS